ncbi:DUF3658 domain-containing protein [Cyclobacterium plantarum]|uniref:DUF1835 domain-containing protein n=1 Tax=Cyclobacterium plantarum TaxID=2716263 RepID=A0ABX0H5T3_9BACT|nr:DUF3658 domain-containing protein [Cyclobacterium plantarum]NHE57209.1 DUF1835 domain-containing protein [Cyclobacterium plantarum]
MEKNQTHIVFGHQEQLKCNIELRPYIGKIVSLKDYLQIGPLYNLHEFEGKYHRQEWFNTNFTSMIEVCHTYQWQQDILKIEYLKHTLTPSSILYIWSGNFITDILGTARLLYELRNINIRIEMTDFNNIQLPHRNGKQWTPSHLTVVHSEDCGTVAKSFYPLDLKKRKYWQDLWISLVKQKGTLRILDGKDNFITKDENYFDHYLKAYMSTEFQNPIRIVGHVLVDTGFAVSDHFFFWRFREMVQSHEAEAEGNIHDIREYLIRLPKKAE